MSCCSQFPSPIFLPGSQAFCAILKSLDEPHLNIKSNQHDTGTQCLISPRRSSLRHSWGCILAAKHRWAHYESLCLFAHEMQPVRVQNTSQRVAWTVWTRPENNETVASSLISPHCGIATHSSKRVTKSSNSRLLSFRLIMLIAEGNGRQKWHPASRVMQHGPALHPPPKIEHVTGSTLVISRAASKASPMTQLAASDNRRWPAGRDGPKYQVTF